jgi:hypothetical protein
MRLDADEGVGVGQKGRETEIVRGSEMRCSVVRTNQLLSAATWTLPTRPINFEFVLTTSKPVFICGRLHLALD